MDAGLLQNKKHRCFSGYNGLVYINKIACRYAGKMPVNTTVVIKDGTTLIAAGAFEKCENLVSVIIPDSVTVIGKKTFYGCKKLNTVKMSKNIRELGAAAFFQCGAVKQIMLSETLVTIGEHAFTSCPKLTLICYNGSNAQEYARNNSVSYEVIR